MEQSVRSMVLVFSEEGEMISCSRILIFVVVGNVSTS
jgi:hypothetical protein